MSKKDHNHGMRISWLITIIAFFGISGLVIAWFGVMDVFGDRSYGVRLRAIAMIVDSLYLLGSAMACALVLRNRSAAAGAIALIGGTISAITGATLLVYQLVNGDNTSWLWAWLGMAIGGTVATVLLLQAGARFPYPKKFAAAVTVTTLLAGANFAYTSLYQPTAQPVQFSVETEIGTPVFNPEKTSASIPIRLSFINNGKVGLQVIAAYYSVIGRRGSIADTDQTRSKMNLAIQSGIPASRRTVISGYDLIQTDTFLREGNFWSPSDRDDINRTVDLSLPTQYDAIGLNATVLVARQDDITIYEDDLLRVEQQSWDPDTGAHILDAPGDVADPGVDFRYSQFPLRETNYLREQTRRKGTASVWRVFGEPTLLHPPGTYLAWQFAPKDASLDKRTVANPNYQLANERYGITWGGSQLEEKSVYELKLRDAPSAK